MSPSFPDAAPPVRARRPRLDHEAVLVAAEGLVDREGYDALTMTLLAGELDTRVSSLYNHVANLEDLRAEIQVRAMQLLGNQVRSAAMGHAGPDGLRVLSHSLRDFARSYPHRYAAMTRAPIDRESFFAAAAGTIEALAVMVRSTGLPEDRILLTGMAVFSALHGFVSLEVSGYFGGVDDLDTVFAQVIRGAVTAAVLEASEPVAATG
ncbi:putative transcriptional regulator, TetR family protein [Nocardioides psychrotolerans]|uniref:WHG domain-containing protein n=1 Tax=Nocardioides psychrotolerans TaxID=1005945 RepID=A0A1I3FUE4_9ACTN|nr:TetR/AcrR family transcriptional regulator [Nocardioides psychrotolerans]GEP37318.1 putative transcriptional regulator, TetR family protein [Nocardioides psychrotolerans]SFI14888.1 WHG domain-containing protein [Nocardioides psychrotolerans]